MKKSSKNVIEQFVEDNFQAMSDQTKEKLFGVSNAVFTDKKI